MNRENQGDQGVQGDQGDYGGPGKTTYPQLFASELEVTIPELEKIMQDIHQ